MQRVHFSCPNIDPNSRRFYIVSSSIVSLSYVSCILKSKADIIPEDIVGGKNSKIRYKRTMFRIPYGTKNYRDARQK